MVRTAKGTSIRSAASNGEQNDGVSNNLMSRLSTIFSGSKSYSSLAEGKDQLTTSKEKSSGNILTDLFFPVDNAERATHESNPDIVSNQSDDMSANNVIAEENLRHGQSWDSASTMQTVSTMGSNMSVNSDTYFSMKLNRSRRNDDDDLTVDAFMLKSENRDKDEDESPSVAQSLDFEGSCKANPVPVKYATLHSKALAYIPERNYSKLLSLVQQNPALLLLRCKNQECNKNNIKEDETKTDQYVRGCYGGALLHVLVSQKPKVMKKRAKRALAFSNRSSITSSSAKKESYEIHVMPTVPETLLLKIIKLNPKVLTIKDDYGRLPLHCATLSLSRHLDEMYKCYGSTHGDGINAKFKHHVTRFVVREVNLVNILLRCFRQGASVSDSKGNLALHYAAAMPPDYKNPSSSAFSKSKGVAASAGETVKILLDAYPRGISTENLSGQMPIHMICSNGPKINTASLKSILFLHSIQRDVPSERDSNGDPPLHIAIKKRASHEVVNLFTTFDPVSSPARLFVQRDENNNTPLHVAMRLNYPPPSSELISIILSIAPFTAASPDGRGKMPIRFATELGMPDHIIKKMLVSDMPIELGIMKDHGVGNMNSKSKASDNVAGATGNSSFARHVVERSHHHSWWHIVVECNDSYLDMLHAFLSTEATHSQIVALARQVGPDGKSVVVTSVSEKCRLMFHSLLCFYDRYEILLSSNALQSDIQVVKGVVQTFHALDYGPRNTSIDKKQTSNKKPEPFSSNSTAVTCGDQNRESMVEVSLLSKEKSKVLLCCYQYEEAFLAEIKVRDKYMLTPKYVEEIYNYHRDETYTHLTLSEAEKLCCITFERPDHTLAEVFANVSAGNRSKKWVTKCCVVLRQIALALKHLHDRNIIHGHLDPSNVAKYGNQWKITNIGTVIPVGLPMRGFLRASAPPESVIEVSRKGERSVTSFEKPRQVNLYKSRSDLIGSPRVKFAKNPASYDDELVSPTLEPNRVKFSVDQKEKVDGYYEKNLSNEHPDSREDLAETSSQVSAEPRDELSSGIQTKRKKSSLPFLKFSQRSKTKLKEDKSNIETPEAKNKYTKKSHLQHKQQNPTHIFAPESCIASPAWDIWSFGLIMVQLLLGHCTYLPNFEKADDALLRNLAVYNRDTLRKIRDQVDKVVGKDGADLVMRLLQPDPSRRPSSMSKVLKHKYFEHPMGSIAI